MNTKKSKSKTGPSDVVVEIGNDWLKVIRVGRSSGTLTVMGMAFEKVDPIRGIPAETVAAVLKRMGATKSPVYAVLPRQMATMRLIELPSIDPYEIADMVELQAGKLTPYSKDEIVSDYKIVGPGRSGYTRVMLAIVQRSVLRSLYSLLSEAGVEVAHMTVGTEGIYNWYKKAARPGLASIGTAVLDIDSGFSDCVIMADERLLFTRSILVGADALMADPESARRKLVKELAQSLQTAANEIGDVHVERIVVTGAALHVDGLTEFLASQMDIPVEVADALQLARRRPKTPALEEAPYNALSLTACIGIAAAPTQLEYALVPESVHLRRELVNKAKGLTLLGMLTVTALVVFSAYGTLRYVFKTEQHAALRTQVEVGEPAVRRLEQMKEMARVVSGRSDVRLAALNVLADIERRLPAPDLILLDQLEFDAIAGTIQLSGTGRTTQDIRDLVGQLEASALFVNVQEGGSTDREPNGRYRFRLQCGLEAHHVL
ncbi:MAG: pilus assembly protein PilM [Verrucomicrobia bacterium]|nr:pilus assembly protein PilM [Verrucomicrobiota bacterium]